MTLKTADEDGNSTVLDVLAALQFVIDHKDLLNIRVVNLSVSSDTPSSYLLDPLDAAVEAAWQSGIVVVAAAGNRGDAADAVSYAPGNDPFVITVGGTDELGTDHPSDDVVADWSSRGVTQDGVSKPDVLAPGAHIVSTLAPGAFFAQLCPACVVGSSYLKIGGTSMAAPVVAGAVALMLQERPELTPNQVKSLLDGHRQGPGHRGRQGVQGQAGNRQPGHPAEPGGPGAAGRRGGQRRPHARVLDAGELDPRARGRGRPGPAPAGRGPWAATRTSQLDVRRVRRAVTSRVAGGSGRPRRDWTQSRSPDPA